MKKLLNTLQTTVADIYFRVKAAEADIEGSDTTEKIGMVVVAVLVVGALATVVNAFMPGLFQQIAQTAQEKLNGIFGTGSYG